MMATASRVISPLYSAQVVKRFCKLNDLMPASVASTGQAPRECLRSHLATIHVDAPRIR